MPCGVLGAGGRGVALDACDYGTTCVPFNHKKACYALIIVMKLTSMMHEEHRMTLRRTQTLRGCFRCPVPCTPCPPCLLSAPASQRQ